ncbi:MAG: BatA domain-containing protein [Thermoguttaceae bacterium]
MPPFVYPALLWGLPLVGIPVLIHLINMLRHRRVEWAAMEFLLVSQKRNRTWIVFKQLLLLLLRMLAVATIVMIVSQPLLRNEFGKLLGSKRTHHILLLDDSFSMSDRWADQSAFGEAKAVVAHIGTVVARHRQPQTFTLLRFSRTGRFDGGTQPDFLKASVNDQFVTQIEAALDAVEVSQTAAGPIEALEAIAQLLGDPGDERRIVYLISDFRKNEWDDPTDLHRHLTRLNQVEAEVHLINCVQDARPNLAVTSLVAEDGIRAAGVPLFVEVSVKNFGTEAAKEVAVMIEDDGQPRPAVSIARIDPGEEVTERFQVSFPTAGEHVVSTRLESDAVEADNTRHAVIEFPIEIPVLLIDGAIDFQDAKSLARAMAPGGAIRTGIRPQIESPRYLGLAPSLDEYLAICVANVERFDPSAIDALEQYAARGGGVAFFLGPKSTSLSINGQLYRDGKGLFPLPVVGESELFVDRLQRAPDLQATDHPILRRAADERYGFLDAVFIHRYYAVPEDWQPEPDSTTRIIARLRNGMPLAVERAFGSGRVVALLTTAAPTWNTWAKNPSFVIATQDLLAYLTRRPEADVGYEVGSRLAVDFPADTYQKQVRFVTPVEDKEPSAAVDATPSDDGGLSAVFSRTGNRGVYEARLTRTDGTIDVRRYAVNVDAAEGDLAALSGTELAPRLDGVKYHYQQAATFQYAVSELAGYNVSRWLLYALILLLVGEQVFAWSAGYHPSSRRRTEAIGGGAR